VCWSGQVFSLTSLNITQMISNTCVLALCYSLCIAVQQWAEVWRVRCLAEYMWIALRFYHLPERMCTSAACCTVFRVFSGWQNSYKKNWQRLSSDNNTINKLISSGWASLWLWGGFIRHIDFLDCDSLCSWLCLSYKGTGTDSVATLLCL